MTGSQIDVLLKTMALVGTLLLIGTFLRAKVSLFQNLFLPACVIGGIIGLILGPRMLGVLPISDEIMTTASNMPGRFFALTDRCNQAGNYHFFDQCVTICNWISNQYCFYKAWS